MSRTRRKKAYGPEAPWDALSTHEIKVGPDLPLTWRTPADQVPGQPRLVFVPGISSDGRAWFRQAPLGRQRPLAFLDCPLEVPQAPYTFDILALLMRDAVHQLCDRPPVLIGSSFGGMIALTYALTFPDAVSGLVLASSMADARWFGYPFNLGHRVISNIPQVLWQQTFPMMCRLAGAMDNQDPDTFDLFADQGRPFRPENYANRIQAVGGLRLQERLTELKLPVLILHGTRDRTIPVRMGIRMARLIPRATLRLLQGGGHSFYMNQANWFNHEVEHWLSANEL